MTIGEYLLELDRQRKALAANLRAKGVAAGNTETIAQLVPKILQIQQEGGMDLPAKGIMLQRVSLTTAAASGTQRVTYDTIAHDDALWTVDLANGTIELPEPGWYSFTGHVRFTTTETGYALLNIVNTATGSSLLRDAQLDSDNAAELALSGDVYIAEPISVALNVFTGGSRAIQSGAAATYLHIVKL